MMKRPTLIQITVRLTSFSVKFLVVMSCFQTPHTVLPEQFNDIINVSYWLAQQALIAQCQLCYMMFSAAVFTNFCLKS